MFDINKSFHSETNSKFYFFGRADMERASVMSNLKIIYHCLEEKGLLENAEYINSFSELIKLCLLRPFTKLKDIKEIFQIKDVDSVNIVVMIKIGNIWLVKREDTVF